MTIEFSPVEARIIGSLMEKSVVTPEQYPLSLNALVLACNQKTSREPVMTLEPGEVLNALRRLEARHLVTSESQSGARVERFAQRFCNSPFGSLTFTPAEFALICVLLLRGAQTPGELRTRCGRLHEFADNADVAATLEALIGRQGGALVARLPRRPGRHDHEYVHCLGGAIESAALEVANDAPVGAPRGDRLAALEERVDALEREVAALREAKSQR